MLEFMLGHGCLCVNRVEVRLLADQWAHGQVVHGVTHLAPSPVLRLQLLRQVLSLAKRRVFELQGPPRPLPPSLPRVNHWVFVDSHGFGQKLRHIFRFDPLDKIFQENLVVDISVDMGLIQVLKLRNRFQFLILDFLVKHERNFIVAGQNGVVDGRQINRRSEIDIGPPFQKVTDDFFMISFASNHQGTLAMIIDGVDLSPAILNKKFNHFDIAVEASTVEWCHFRFLSDALLEDIRVFVQQLLYIAVLLPLDIVEHVLTDCI